MKKIISSLILLIMICNIFAPLSIASEDTSDIVIFGDEKLKRAFINYGADTNNDGNLTVNELNSEWITYLYSSENITSLSGIEYATNLTEISLYNLQSNVDFSELSKLPNLRKLIISGKITDITSLQQVSQLKELSINAFSGAETVNLEPVKNLTNLESLILYGNISNHTVVGELSKLNTLEINIYNTTDTLDLNAIGKISTLEKLTIQNVNVEISPIANLTNLKELSLTLNFSNFDTDLAPLNKLEKLEKLAISNVNSNLLPLANLTNLKDLSLYFASNTNEGINSIEKLTNLENLKLSNFNDVLPNLSKLTKLKELSLTLGMNNSDTFSNMDKIKIITTLEKLELSGTLGDISGLEEMTSLKELILINPTNIYNLKENEFINTINKLKASNVLIRGTYVVNLGNIVCGESKEFVFEEINPILKSIMTEGDTLYNSNLQLSGSSYGNMSTFTIDNENKKIKIIANKFGDAYSYVSTNNSSSNSGFSGSFMITWHNMTTGDTTKEIEFKDENLKSALLENYDIDKDKRITENDMINYSTMDLSNKNITDIAGLEYATNLTTLDLSNNYIIDITTLEKLNNLKELKLNNNRISDLSPLKDMLKIEDNTFKNIHMQNNFVEDVTCLAGCDFEELDLKGNYIDFSEGSKNREIVEDSIEKSIRKQYYDYGITNQTEEEYVETLKQSIIDSVINTWYYLYEKYGSVVERNDEVEFETELKQTLIEAGVDSNNDSKITKGELNDFGIEDYRNQEVLDLSNLNINNIEGLKYLSNVTKINLSNNNILDVSPLKECRTLEELDLSNNNISDITAIGEMYSVYDLNLSNNNITNIDALKNLRTKNNIIGHDDYWSGGGGPYRNLNIDLSNNKITNISAINGLKTLKYINLSKNRITDISSLRDFDFKVEKDWDEELLEDFTGIDLSQNYIDLEETNNKTAISVFKEKGVTLTFTNQKELKNTLGDPSGDGKITTVDAIRILQYISKKITLDESQIFAADTNGDGKINTVDVIKILQYISKKITEF